MSFSTALMIVIIGFFMVATIVCSVFRTLIELLLATKYNMRTEYFLENNQNMMKKQALWEILGCVMIC